MSYCRFIEGDVYAYVCDGGVQFYVADNKRELDRLCNTFNEAYQYAKELRDTHGLDVPSHAIEALKADALEEAARICGLNGAVEDLKAENEELRKELAVTNPLFETLNAANDRLIFENSELRELVRDVFTLHWHGLDCTECPKRFRDRCTHLGGCEWLGILSDRMRELGIEA